MHTNKHTVTVDAHLKEILIIIKPILETDSRPHVSLRTIKIMSVVMQQPSKLLSLYIQRLMVE